MSEIKVVRDANDIAQINNCIYKKSESVISGVWLTVMNLPSPLW